MPFSGVSYKRVELRMKKKKGLVIDRLIFINFIISFFRTFSFETCTRSCMEFNRSLKC